MGDDGKPIPDEEMLIIGKNRNGGVGSLPVYFDERRLQFLERTRCSKNLPQEGAVSGSFHNGKNEQEAQYQN